MKKLPPNPPTQEPETYPVPAGVFKQGTLNFSISMQPETNTFSVSYDNVTPESMFCVITMLRQQMKKIVDREVENKMKSLTEKASTKHYMSKTLFNKHLHFIELCDGYQREIASRFEHEILSQVISEDQPQV